jgi:hypothetical protein
MAATEDVIPRTHNDPGQLPDPGSRKKTWARPPPPSPLQPPGPGQGKRHGRARSPERIDGGPERFAACHRDAQREATVGQTAEGHRHVDEQPVAGQASGDRRWTVGAQLRRATWTLSGGLNMPLIVSLTRFDALRVSRGASRWSPLPIKYTSGLPGRRVVRVGCSSSPEEVHRCAGFTCSCAHG